VEGQEKVDEGQVLPLPLVEPNEPVSRAQQLAAGTTSNSAANSLRHFHTQSFDSSHNIALPQRIDCLGDDHVTDCAAGGTFLWCLGYPRSDTSNMEVLAHSIAAGNILPKNSGSSITNPKPYTMTTRVGWNTAYEQATLMSPDYVENVEFRLQFLRGDTFDVKSAARMISYFEWKQDLFGPENLTKDITLRDLDEESLNCLKTGFMHPLPIRDKSGRAIFCSCPALMGNNIFPVQNRVRALVPSLSSMVKLQEIQSFSTKILTLCTFENVYFLVARHVVCLSSFHGGGY
jgi:hypothetical protein